MAAKIRSLHHVVKRFRVVKAIFVNMKWSIHTDNLVSFGNSILIFFDMRFCTFRCCGYRKEMFLWWVHSLFLLLKRYSSSRNLEWFEIEEFKKIQNGFQISQPIRKLLFENQLSSTSKRKAPILIQCYWRCFVESRPRIWLDFDWFAWIIVLSHPK